MSNNEADRLTEQAHQAFMKEFGAAAENAAMNGSDGHYYGAVKTGWMAAWAALAKQQAHEATAPIMPVAPVNPSQVIDRVDAAADTRRLDHLQARGATIQLVNVATRGIELQFRVGGLHKSLSPDLRTAIDTSIDIRAAQTAQISLLDRPTNGE